jgi:hypothetical protein
MSTSQLQQPIEFLEMRDQEVREFQPLRYQQGTTKIHNKQDPPGVMKDIHLLRVWFQKDPGRPGLGYLDISSMRLMAMLQPLLDQAISEKKKVKVQAFGSRPATQFTVQLL